ncbi:hypothetical protein A1O3_00479 [Capronia epimyces CBS 606.96]|uniref:Esterase n=1 Tax=Capronia epimyces CBS 606.96 TaxID=1182542 RepID=W9ZBP7_9EURO|nr:uncharacterized protein A1O3_00479 [Capronia epimyces CBS 606.96]EXJ91929.1 hypothetical protein A1O3_00479 [Capronia epimyces CBS 606.96]
METILHIYHPKRHLLLLEYAIKSPSSSPSPSSGVALSQTHSNPPNVLLFVGGLYDNFRSPSYVDDLAALFLRDTPNQKWRVMHVQLSSAGKSFGLYDLDRDVEEIGTAINYIRASVTQSPTSPVVLMGHSTGCQDLIHYLVSPLKNSKNSSNSRPVVSGAIFQAPVSDREAIMRDVNDDQATRQAYESCLSIAESTPKDKHAMTILPLHISKQCLGPAPLNITRFLSLASPGSPDNPAMDDYFSSDLSDRRLLDTFGRIGGVAHLQASKHTGEISSDLGHSSEVTGRSVLFLPSGDDEHVPTSIDKALLLSRWTRAVESGGAASVSPYSQIVRHALHDISGSSIEARTARLVEMRGSVLRYLDHVVGDIFEEGSGVSTEKGDASEHSGQGPWAIYESDRHAIEMERGVSGVRL